MEWKQGAYFGTVFYPIAICLFAIFVLLLFVVPVPVKLTGPVRVCLLALLAIAALTLLSALWSSTPAAAFAYSARIVFFAALFVLGIGVAAWAGARWEIALAPVAVAGAGVALATTIVLATGTDIGWYLQGDGTLRFPIGYRNADVAFFLICFWPLLGIATADAIHWTIRAASVSGATVLLGLALLGQSRGSLPALAIALLVFTALSEHRLRAVLICGLAGIPLLPFLSQLLSVFRYGADESPGIPILHEAARAILYSAALSLLLAIVAFAFFQPRLRIGAARVKAISWVGAVAVCLATLVGAGVFVEHHGGPIGFVEQRTHEFDKIGYPNLHSHGVRYGVDIASNRHDFWRVAVDEGLRHPILGGGAGSFQLEYLRHRRSYESPHDPHSIEAVLFGELGFPGFLLLACFVIAGIWAVVRARRRKGAAACLVAAGAAGATQWLVHGSYDWFWQYAGITGLGIYLLGVAVAPGLGREEARLSRASRYGIAAVLAAVSLMVIPFLVSETYEKRAHTLAASDPAAAVADLRRAADLDPWAAEPLIGQALLEAEAGEIAPAVATFRKATEREPENYAPYLFTAEILASSKPRAAAKALGRALELNPLEPRASALRTELRRTLAHRRDRRLRN
jgi:hypothetical protein